MREQRKTSSHFEFCRWMSQLHLSNKRCCAFGSCIRYQHATTAFARRIGSTQVHSNKRRCRSRRHALVMLLQGEHSPSSCRVYSGFSEHHQLLSRFYASRHHSSHTHLPNTSNAIQISQRDYYILFGQLTVLARQSLLATCLFQHGQKRG